MARFCLPCEWIWASTRGSCNTQRRKFTGLLWIEDFPESEVERASSEIGRECSSPSSTVSTVASAADFEEDFSQSQGHSREKVGDGGVSHLEETSNELDFSVEETGLSNGSSAVAACPEADAGDSTSLHGLTETQCVLHASAPLPRELHPIPSDQPRSSSQFLASLMQRVGHSPGSGSRGMSYQVQVIAPSSSSSQMPASASSESTGSESLRLLNESTFSQRRVDVPWALFPYFFDLLPTIDGVPCDGLLMVRRLVGLMSQHGFNLRKASPCPHSDAATTIELHGAVSEREWKTFEEMIWVWGVAVMSSRVPLELSPHRSLILDMVS